MSLTPIRLSASELHRLEVMLDYAMTPAQAAVLFAPVLALARNLAPVDWVEINVVDESSWHNLVCAGPQLAASVPRDEALCTEVIEHGREVVLSNLDEQTCHLRGGEVRIAGQKVRSYAGFPIRVAGTQVVASLCVLAAQPVVLDEAQHERLRALASLAGSLFELHRAQAQRARVTHLLALQSDLLRYSSVHEPVESLSTRLLTGLEVCTPRARAVLMIVSEDRHRLLWLGGPSMPPGFVDWSSSLDIAKDLSVAGTAAARKKEVLCADLQNDSTFRDLAPRFAEFNIAAAWSLPLLTAENDVIGTLTLYCEEARLPTDDERACLAVAASTGSIIIERERSLRALIESERLLNEAQELAGLGAYTVHLDTDMRSGSRITNRLLGLPPELPALSTEEYNRLIHPDDMPQLTAARDDAIRTGGQLHTTYRVIRASDGAVRWIEAHGLPIRDLDGRVIRFTGVLQDITGRRHAEEDLRLNQRAIEYCSTGIVILDARSAALPLIYVNPAYEDMSGYAREELLGRPLPCLDGVWAEQPPARELTEAVRRGVEGRAILPHQRKDGSAYWVDLRLSPVRDEAGQVSHFIGSQTDYSDRIRYENELSHQARHDSLTGLANRSALRDLLAQALTHAAEAPARLALVFVDLDGFKLINDSLGHAAGDVVLKECASRIRRAVGARITAARMGGDEFVLLLPEPPDDAELTSRVASLLDTLRAPISFEQHTVSISASAGIALYPDHGTSAAVLLRHADAAMYRAKSIGRSKLQFFTEGLASASGDKLRLKEELQLALGQQQFVLHYQPKVEASTGALLGFEALVRWQHPERGLLLPGLFIRAAEELLLIADLGLWVLDEACRQIVAWRAARRFDLPVAVNVSAAQFRDDRFVDHIRELLVHHRLDARLLELEITESMVMDNPERFIQILADLDYLGVRISVDDFGEGYSSLSFVKRFPIDYLKIEQSFVRDIGTDPQDAAICETIITMAHNLGLKVIAEGVETLDQARFLQARGCDVLQGYLIARPQSADADFGRFPRAPWLV